MSKRINSLNQTNPGSIRKRLAPFFGLSSALILSAFLLCPLKCLAIESKGRLLFAVPIRAGEIFEVSFIHSLNLSPVTDVIEWTGREMIVRKSIFKTFGAGIPIPSDGIGTELVHIDGRYELIGIDKEMPGFTIMTQTIPDHKISFKGYTISLLEAVGPGKPVDIRVKPVPRLYLIIKNNKTEVNHAIFQEKK